MEGPEKGNKSDLSVSDDLGPLEGADVAEEFDDVLLRHRRLQVRHDDLGALQRAHVRRQRRRPAVETTLEPTFKPIL